MTLATRPAVVVDLGVRMKGSRVAEIKAAMSHVVVLTDDGRLLGWGASRKGQIGGDAVAAKVIWSPVQIDLGFPVRTTTLGRDFTYVVDENDIGHLLGDNKHLGDVKALEIRADDTVSAGWTHLFSWARDQLVAVGRNNHGQLPPPSMISPKLFATGSEHSLALMPDNTILAWGWGEHGNCGGTSDDNDTSEQTANHILLSCAENEKVTFLAAGCATSFIGLSEND
jgi:protein ATS1